MFCNALGEFVDIKCFAVIIVHDFERTGDAADSAGAMALMCCLKIEKMIRLACVYDRKYG